MKVLVIGSGGREHALAWKLAQSPKVREIFVAPGNAGTASFAKNVDINANDIDGLIEFAKKHQVDLTVVGPERPLTVGIVDRFNEEGLRIFGPSSKAARLESSKVFTREFCLRNSIPGTKFAIFDSVRNIEAHLKVCSYPCVVKADGLASGKGVIICNSFDEAMKAAIAILEEGKFGEAGRRIVVEEFLTGTEMSFIAICDGQNILPLETSQDHKRLLDGDLGPNTGGMGAYSPSVLASDLLNEKIMQRIMWPTVKGMKALGSPFVGTLYAGLIIDEHGDPRLLEFNVRFGDPETQPILTRLETDLVDILEAAIDGKLENIKLKWDPSPSVCVVMASSGYPEKYRVGLDISGLENTVSESDTVVFHAGTKLKNGNVVTDGGRVLGVTAKGADLKAAIDTAYKAAERISWEGCYYRKDVGKKSLGA
ncbi:MAG: phosphoribosylamine--glycine ligase [Pseudomonadota bacterium]